MGKIRNLSLYLEEKYNFWNEVPYHSESALLHRLQEIEDEVKEKRLVNYVNSCIIQNYQRIYLPAREKESTM